MRTPAHSHLSQNHLRPSDHSANARHHPYQEFRDLDQDQASNVPLDAFDKELLAAEPAGERSWQASRGLARMSLPPKSFLTRGNLTTTRQEMRDELHTTPRLQTAASSSPGQVVSSPTVVALSRRHDHGQNVIATHSSEGDNSSPLIRKGTAVSSAPVQVSHRIPQPASQIQLLHAPPVVQGIPLVSLKDLPDRLRSLFPFPLFNAVQSRCYDTAFRTNDNLVLSAPTGSGKTVVMELAICHLMHVARGEEFKIVYQAPTKALCSERCADWQSKFGSLDMQCAELTGDTDASQMRQVQAANIIITTPEKWDSITRRWKDHTKLMRLVRLFLIDEVHTLKESRGATLEAVVSRMKSAGSSVRFIALSATIPNSEDVAMWLGRDSMHSDLPAHQEVFGQEFRPVRLQKIVYGYSGKSNDFYFDTILETKLPEIIAKHSQRKPIMIFCPFRKSCVKTAKVLAQLWESTRPADRLWPGPIRAPQLLNDDLRKFSSAGVAFHHAGLDISDRRAIEQGFLSHNISIICCTSTLAVGVNLPCYLVIIKGTRGWTDNGCQEYADLEMMQMLGRAGRPQFEQSACAVILTQDERFEYYNKLGSGQEPLESCLHLNLTDHLNAEIGLGTVSDLVSAKRWLASTFLFVRLSKNANHYRLKEDLTSRNDDELLEQICSKDVTLLQAAHLVTSGANLNCTEFGHLMAKYYVKFDSMKILLSLPPKAKLSEIISNIAQAVEFRDIRLKVGEKSLYKQINKDVGIKFPIQVDIALPAHKVSLLLQAELGGVECPTGEPFAKYKFQFQQDKAMVFKHVNRLVRCIIDCQLIQGDSGSTRHALELARSFGARVWDNSPLQLKQLDQIGNVALRKLASAGINSIELLENTEAHRIETVVGRGPPFGMKLLSNLTKFPKLRVLVTMVGRETKTQSHIRIGLRAEIGFLNEIVPAFFRRKPIFVCFLAETSDGQLIDFRRFAASKLKDGHEIFLSAELTKPSQYVSCHVMCDEIAGTCKSTELRPQLPASLFPTSTEQKVHQQDFKSLDKDLGSSQLQDACRKRKRSEDFGNGGLDDGDLLAAESVETMDIDAFENELARLPSSTDRALAKEGARPKKQRVNEDDDEPVQLKDGKWACNHKCKDKTLCKHICCKSGLDKPPRPSRKSTSGKTEGRLSIPSMLDVINKISPDFLGDSNMSSSVDEARKQRHSLSSKGEARSPTRLHEPITPVLSNHTFTSARVLSHIENVNSQQTSPAASARLRRTSEHQFAEGGYDFDWANDINIRNIGDSTSPQSSVGGELRNVEATRAKDDMSQNDTSINVDDGQFDFDDNDASILEASLVGLEDSMLLNKDSARFQNAEIDSLSNASISSGTVRALSSSRADRSPANNLIDCDDVVHDSNPENSDAPHGLAPLSPKTDASERGQDRSSRNESTTSSSKRLFFTSPERGQSAQFNSFSKESPWQERHEARIASSARNGRAPLKVISNIRPADPTLDKTEPPIQDISTDADENAECKQRAEGGGGGGGGGGGKAEVERKLWKDGIDPSFYDEFKDVVDFV